MRIRITHRNAVPAIRSQQPALPRPAAPMRWTPREIDTTAPSGRSEQWTDSGLTATDARAMRTAA